MSSSQRPDTPDRQHDSNETNSGSEAAQGIHNAKSNDRSRNGDADTTERPGSEPLVDRKDEHVSGYGGKNGDPKTSSDQR
jgi:hypothetical protein